MTGQTKHYVELSDIVALRFECEECHATVSLPITDNIRTHGIRACPSCNEPWAMLPESSSSMEVAIQKAGTSIKELESVLKRMKELINRKGFSISLELKPEASTALAAGRAADVSRRDS